MPDAGPPDAGPPDAFVAPDAGEPPVATTGCGCRTGRDVAPWPLALLLPVLARRRRS